MSNEKVRRFWTLRPDAEKAS